MSADAPSTGYSVVENHDKTRSYLCDLCPEASADIDAARAHRAVHVAGPELLKTLHDVKDLSTYEHGGIENADVTDMQEDLESIREAAEAAIASVTPPPKG